jgi:hypothetical protein
MKKTARRSKAKKQATMHEAGAAAPAAIEPAASAPAQPMLGNLFGSDKPEGH